MADYVLKPIGDTSWILQDAKQQRLALVSKVNNVLMAVGLDRTEFLEVDDLASYLGHTITVLEPVADTDDDGADELSIVFGFPVRYQQVFDTQESPVPNFLKKQDSRIRYAAGYFGISFDRGWVPAFCPKLITLTNNEYIVPFATRLEMHNSISQAKRDVKRKNKI